MQKIAIVTFCIIFVGFSQIPPPLPVLGDMASLFTTNTYFVAGNLAYCMDVLGSGKLAFGLAEGGTTENPEGRTDVLLTQQEYDTGNLIPLGGPGINPVTARFDKAFGVYYTYDPDGVPPIFEISAVGYTLTLNLADYPDEDICIVYLREQNGRSILLVWGYGWRGTYAGSAFIGDPVNWQIYGDAHLLMLRWTDSNGDGLVQMSEISVEYVA